MKTASEIREGFLSFFEERKHRRVRSSSLVPADDPTLLFTNAGMNQFKQVFLGLETRDYQRATSSQKCMRVSGKHNDLEAVGRTARHHTFFEMLGNFSFGDYFKKEAIEYAWELCTQVYGLSPERLFISVYQEDNEALALWRDHMGIPAVRIFKMGKKDNFWTMGETGPCGPCSELHYDMLTSPAGHKDCSLECDCGRYVEIWNLVFMQFNREGSGQAVPLSSPSIDTGMGLERLACVLQGTQSNYETDLFRPLVEEAARLTGTSYGQEENKDVSLRILADHGRACAFLINDGVVPGNEGRGYVLRKILRRAIRHGKMLGKEDPFIFTLTTLVSQLLKEPYPELEKSREYSAKIVKNEEESFSSTLTYGTQLLDEVCEDTLKKKEDVLPGSDLFRLYDTYGFPLDLAKEIAAERGLKIDEEGFTEELEKQRQRARVNWKGSKKEIKPIFQELAKQKLTTHFTGHTEINHVEAQVLALLQNNELISELPAGQTGEIIFNQTPFYAEGGGQVADTGMVEAKEMTAVVKDVYKPIAGLHVHAIQVKQGMITKGTVVHCTVGDKTRHDTASNHTATHLLQASLRDILGEHVKQSGSLVTPNRLRFDFAHYQSVTSEELCQIEELVNNKIRENIEVQTEIRNLEEAIQEGAMALFGEKYQENVRVVTIPGFSMELCGGTHVARTGHIALFKIISESSISAGVRRVEAVTGAKAYTRFLEDELLLKSLSDELHVQRNELLETIGRMAQELKGTHRQIEQLQLQLAQQESNNAIEQAREIHGVRILSQKVNGLDRKALRQLADQLKDKLKTGVVVLGTPINDKVSLVVMVTSDLTDRIKADDLIQKIAPLVKGGGGGKSELAEAGGKDAGNLENALEHAYKVVEKLLKP